MTSRASLLIAAAVALATTSGFAARWDPAFVDEPQAPREVTLSSDLEVPTVEWEDWMGEYGHLERNFIATLDSHALTVDGRVFPRPSDPNVPFDFPSHHFALRTFKGGFLLFAEARTPFSVMRGVLRALDEVLLVVQGPDGERGVVSIIGTEHHSQHPGRPIHLARGTITIDGTVIPPLASGAVDVATLRRTFHPLVSPVIVPADDTPLSDVVRVMVQYMPSEFTHPVIELWPGETTFRPANAESNRAADSRAMEGARIEAGLAPSARPTSP